MNNIFRIDSRRQYSMASSWDEYLFLSILDNEYNLFVGKYDILCELDELCTELNIEGEDFNEDEHLPKTYKDQEVVGIEDGYVCGGDIYKEEDYGEVSFKVLEKKIISDYLNYIGWDDIQSTVQKIENNCNK